MGNLLTILSVQLQGWGNTVRRASAGQRFFYVAVLGIGLLLFVGNLLFAFTIVNLPRLLTSLQSSGVNLPEEVRGADLSGVGGQVLNFFFLGATSFLLFDSISTSLPNLYQARDLNLLLASPLTVRSVFFSKLILALGRPYLLLFTLGLPYLVGVGLGLGYGWFYYLMAGLLLLCLPLITAGIGVLVTALLVRVLPAHRLSEAIALVGGVAGVLLAAIIVFGGLTAVKNGNLDASAGSILAASTTTNLGYLPTNWAAYALQAAGKGEVGNALAWAGLFALVAGSIYLVGTLISANLFYAGWINLGVSRRRRRGQIEETRLSAAQVMDNIYGAQRGGDLIQQSGRLRALAGAWRSVRGKDLTILWREPAYIVQLLGPVLVSLVFMLQARQSANLNAASRQLAGQAFATVCLWVLFISSFAAGLIGLSSFTREQKAIWMLKLAPVGTGRLVLAKFGLAYGLLLAFGLSFSLIYSLLVGAQLYQLVGFIIAVAVGGLGSAGLCVGIGTTFGTLNSTSPQSIGLITALASLLGLLFYIVALLIGTGVAVGIAFRFGPLGAVVGLLLVAGFIASVTLVPLYVAQRRLADLEL